MTTARSIRGIGLVDASLKGVPFTPPPDPGWTYVLDDVLPRLGMWTGRETFERAVCFVQGFDLACGSRIEPLLQEWVQERYGETSLGWPWVLVRLTRGIPRDAAEDRDLGELTPDEDHAALTMFKDALREVVAAI